MNDINLLIGEGSTWALIGRSGSILSSHWWKWFTPKLSDWLRINPELWMVEMAHSWALSDGDGSIQDLIGGEGTCQASSYLATQQSLHLLNGREEEMLH